MLFNPARSEYWRRKNKTPEALRAVRHFLGYLLLHNVRPQSGVCIYNEAVQLERLLYSIGWGGPSVEFHPYWRKDGPVRSTGGTLVSAFTFPGKLLAVVLNDRDRKTVAAITAPEKYKGRIYDLESGLELKSARAEVPGKGFRLLVFEEKEK